MLRLHLLPETPAEGPAHACAAIRLLHPWQHPSLAHAVSVTTGPGLPPGRLDAVVTQRAGPPTLSLAGLQAMVGELRRRRIPLIQDLDDDLLSEHPSARVEAQLAAHGTRPRLRFLLREADAVVTSTPALAERVARLAPAVHVWPNALDERLALPLPSAEGAALGYFGTLSHLEDFLPVVGPLEAALARRGGRPRVELCGIAEDARLGGLFQHAASVVLLPPDGDYPRFLAGRQQAPRWCAGIAPLADNPFNRGKSDIKFLDYALFGAPGIYADLPVYAAVQDGVTGLKAPPGGFGAALTRLLGDPPLRQRIRRQAREWVLEERVLARRAPDLLAILHRVLDSRRAAA
jgi:glycosyltransferase involved in cell wall biosynthesis